MTKKGFPIIEVLISASTMVAVAAFAVPVVIDYSSLDDFSVLDRADGKYAFLAKQPTPNTAQNFGGDYKVFINDKTDLAVSSPTDVYPIEN